MGRMKLKKTIEISNIDKIIVIFIIVIVSTFIRIKTFSIKSNSILLNFAKNQSTKIATTIINISLKNIFEDDMTEVMQITSDKYGNVLRIDFNNKKVNRLNYQINNSILSSIIIGYFYLSSLSSSAEIDSRIHDLIEDVGNEIHNDDERSQYNGCTHNQRIVSVND